MRDYLRQMFGGPGELRFFIQPALALLLGIRDGRRDARAGQRPYLFALLTAGGDRFDRLLVGLESLLVPLAVAFLGSLAFQYLTHDRLRLAAAIGYVTVFVVPPYVAARALTNRGASRLRRRGPDLTAPSTGAPDATDATPTP